MSDLARVAVRVQMFFGFAFVIGAVGLALSDRRSTPSSTKVTPKQHSTPDGTETT
jgi:hypothetical protein